MLARARGLVLAGVAVAMLTGAGGERAEVFFPDGRRYEGELRDGKPHGRGVMTWPGFGDRYEGEFREGKMHGRGVMTGRSMFEGWKTGAPDFRFEGEFRDGMLHKGIMDLGATRYEGEFSAGRWHGQGVMTFESLRYEGGFRGGMYHGQGVYTDLSGARYEGEWRDGDFHGGVYTSPDGQRSTCFPGKGEPCPVAP